MPMHSSVNLIPLSPNIGGMRDWYTMPVHSMFRYMLKCVDNIGCMCYVVDSTSAAVLELSGRSVASANKAARNATRQGDEPLNTRTQRMANAAHQRRVTVQLAARHIIVDDTVAVDDCVKGQC
jgi:phage major head subunit gpT-like protein